MRDFIDLLETQMLLEDRTQALETKFTPMIANYLKLHDVTAVPTSHRTQVRHDIDEISHHYEPARGSFNSVAMAKFHAAVDTDENFFTPVYYQELAKWVVHYIMAGDPDPRKSFSNWLLVLYLKGRYRLEDIHRATSALELFADLVRRKKLPVESRDINKIPDFVTLLQIVQPFMAEHLETQNSALEQQFVAESDVILDTPTRRILKINSGRAAQWFGRNTEWCTAYGGEWGKHKGKSHNYYEHYVKDGPLFIFQDLATNQIFQFHAHSKQLMNIHDQRVRVDQFVATYPEINDAMIKYYLQSRTVLGEIDGMTILWNTERKNTGIISLVGDCGIHFQMADKDPPVVVIGSPTNNQYDIFSYRTSIPLTSPLRKKLIDVLNQLKFFGSLHTMLADGIVYDKAYRKYVDMASVSPLSKLKKHGDCVWKTAARTHTSAYRYEIDGTESVYQLINSTGKIMCQVGVTAFSGGGEIKMEIPDLYNARRLTWSKDMSASVYDLLSLLGNRKEMMLADRGKIFRLMDRPLAKDLAKQRPDWLPVSEYVLFHGTTAISKRKINAALEEAEVDIGHWDGDRLVVEEYADFDHFAQRNGEQDLIRFCDYTINHSKTYTADWDVYIDKDVILDLLESIPEKDLARLSAYMKKKYTKSVWPEDNVFDTAKGLAELQVKVDDQPLMDAVRDSRRTGDEAGTYRNILSAVKRVFEDNPFLFFKLPSGKLSRDWSVKLPVVVAPTAPEAADLISDLTEVINDGWAEALNDGLKFDVSGADDIYDCDDATAYKYFAEAIDEFLP